jgi:hypothetical protein
MNTKLRLLIAACATLSTLTFAAAADTEQSAPRMNQPVTSKPARHPLEKDMDAETVRQIAGLPAEIHPMQAPEGVAEKWIYRRVIDSQTRQVNVGEAPVSCHTLSPNFTEMPFSKRVGIPIRRIETTTIYQVTALLMYNNKLVIARQWKEASASYDN